MIKSVAVIAPGKNALTMIINKGEKALSTVQHTGTKIFGDSEKTIIAVPNIYKEKALIKYLLDTKTTFSRIPGFLKKDDLAHKLDYLIAQQNMAKSTIAMA